jgi:CRISPR-associated protein Csm2
MTSIAEVKRKIQNLRQMSELKPDEFTEENGLADSLASEFGENLKPTQLRKVFTEIKRIRRKVERDNRSTAARAGAFDRTQLLHLMPTLAYASGRKLLPKEFYEILKLILGRDRLQTNTDFLRAADFIEAVLAYHKYRASGGGQA